VLSQGPNLHLPGLPWASPYGLLLQTVPGFASIRAPARFGMLAALGLSLAAAAGYRWVDERLGARRGVRAAVFGLAFVFAVAEAPLSGVQATRLPTAAEIPEGYRWLKGHGTGALLELPHTVSGTGGGRPSTCTSASTTGVPW
jgi:hypothetical protein